MKVSYAHKGQVLVIRFAGELDENAAPQIRHSIEAELRRGGKHLLFDFRKMSFMDSSGIGLILGRYKEISLWDGKMAYYGADKHIQRLLKISGLLRLGKLFTSEEEALESLKGGSR